MIKYDSRTKRTYELLMGALYDMLAKKPFDEIRVKDICENAGVHRTTFYKHFEDKYQFLSFCLSKWIYEFKGDLSKATATVKHCKFYEVLCEHLTDFLYDNTEHFHTLLKYNAHSTFSRILHDTTCEHISSYLKELEDEGYEFTLPVDVIAQYRSGGIISAGFYMLENNTSKEDFRNNLVKLMDISRYIKNDGKE